MASIHIQTVVVILIFAIWYLHVLLRRIAMQKIDIYDLIMLSTVAVVPVLFVIAPSITLRVSNALGVEFPFVLLFGVLIAVVFLFVHRVTLKLYKVENDYRQLIQEISMLRHDIDFNRKIK